VISWHTLLNVCENHWYVCLEARKRAKAVLQFGKNPSKSHTALT
jgi:hypothetical protein